MLPTTRETRDVPDAWKAAGRSLRGSGCSSRGNPPHPGEGGEITSRCPCSRAEALGLLRGAETRTKGEGEALSGGRRWREARHPIAPDRRQRSAAAAGCGGGTLQSFP